MDTRVAKKEWSLTMRANHWCMVLSIFVLIGTGFYIANPFTTPAGETTFKFLMGNMRYVHMLLGVILTFIFLQRIYLMFFSRFHADFKDFFAWTDGENFWKQLKYYALISDEKPGHRYLYGPLQSLAYGGLLIMLLLIVLTGLILSGACYHAGLLGAAGALLKPLENAVGGLATVRFIHHILPWLFIIFVVVHVYMAFWYDAVFKEGTVSSMIGGRIFRKGHEEGA